MLNTSCIDLVRMTLNVISWGFRHFDASSLAYKIIKFRARIGLKYLISISVHWTLTEDVFTTFLICSFRPWLRWYRCMFWEKLTNASYNIHLKFKLYHIIAKLRWHWTTNCSACITTMPSRASKKMYMTSVKSIQRKVYEQIEQVKKMASIIDVADNEDWCEHENENNLEWNISSKALNCACSTFYLSNKIHI